MEVLKDGSLQSRYLSKNMSCTSICQDGNKAPFASSLQLPDLEMQKSGHVSQDLSKVPSEVVPVGLLQKSCGCSCHCPPGPCAATSVSALGDGPPPLTPRPAPAHSCTASCPPASPVTPWQDLRVTLMCNSDHHILHLHGAGCACAGDGQCRTKLQEKSLWVGS